MAIIFAIAAAACSKNDAPDIQAIALQIAVQPPASVASGTMLAPAPAVHVVDGDGRELRSAGVPVSVTLTEVSATLLGTLTRQTDADGRVAFDDLVIVGKPGTYKLAFTAPGLHATESWGIQVLPATSGPALRVAVQPPDQATMRVVLSPAPAVQLESTPGVDWALGGVTVTIQLGGGSGALAGTTIAQTDASGRAVFSNVAFAGAAAGMRTLAFSAAGFAPVASQQIAVAPGPAATIEAFSAVSQTSPAGQPVLHPPAVRVKDADGNPVAGVTVTFTVTAGGGSVQGSPSTRGSDGVAALEAWTLGSSGTQTVEASATGLFGSPITFDATLGQTGGQYAITLQFLTGATNAQRLAFERARTRVEEVIVGDIPDVTITPADDMGCGTISSATAVDDLLIFVELTPIDGKGGILGQAGPCVFPSDRTPSLPAAGIMRFDTADLQTLEAAGQLESVVLHEMLHVVGFGVLWNENDFALLTGGGGSDPYFTGSGARAAFRNYDGGLAYPGTPVPVEAGGGIGTRDSHWRESVFGRELMTGWLSGTTQPMSHTTIASLGDLGYDVDETRADSFDIGSAALRAAAGDEPALFLAGDVLVFPH